MKNKNKEHTRFDRRVQPIVPMFQLQKQLQHLSFIEA
jgi:hypothetical protein